MSVNKQSDNQPPGDQARRYESPRRRQQAAATRRRILAAAERLFAEQGYAAVTMEAIAQQAGVSLATIYLYFPGRTAVVGALVEEIVAAPELSVEQIIQGAEPQEQLRAGTHILRRLNERSWLITDILRSQQGNDPEIAQLWALWQQRHLNAIRRAMVVVAKTDGLRPGLSAETAVDVFYAIAGTEVYRALVRERGWTPEEYEHWLFEVARRELLP